MYRKLADTIILDFTVHLPTTGAVSDADALPTVEIWEDENDTTLAGGTVTKRVGKTGNYRVAVVATATNGFEVGKSYNVVVTAIAGGVTAKAVIGSFFIDSKRLDDLNDLTAQQVWEYATRTLSSFGTLVTDAAAAVWASLTRTLTDKAGFTISGTKQTLDALQDLSQDGAQAGATAALNAYDAPTRAEATADKAEITALETKVLQVLANRLVVVPATGAYTIYADDGVTPLLAGTISDTGRSVPTWP